VVLEVLRSQRRDIGVAIGMFISDVKAITPGPPTDLSVTQAFVIPFLEYLLSVAVSDCRRLTSAASNVEAARFVTLTLCRSG
jgi:hypothetical protein